MANYKSIYTGAEIDTGIGKANTALQEHQKLKTINNESLVGEGDITIEGTSYEAGANIQISEENVISATDTIYDDTELREAIAGKQEELVSGTNIKTINGNSILGEGNLVIEGGEGGLTSVAHDDTLTGAGTNENPLGVDTTKIALKSDIPDISEKQDILVSGENIKTINGQSILGEGGIDIGGGSVEANVDLTGDETHLKSLSVGNIKYSTKPDLSGKVISIMGDSISTYAGWIPNSQGIDDGTGTLRHAIYYPNYGGYVNNVNMTWWHKLIFDKFKAKFGINESWSGSFVGNNKDTNSATTTTCHAPGNDTGPDTCMASNTRIKRLAANGTPDIIYVYGGTNDIAQPGTPGESLGSFNSSTDYSTVDITTTKWTYFVDAYRTMIQRMQYYYPKAKIIALLPTYCHSYYNRAKLDEWVEQIKLICDYFGVNYIDLRACGITWANSSSSRNAKGVQTLGDNNIHPNDLGHTMIANYVESETYKILQQDYIKNEVYTVTNDLSTLTNKMSYVTGITKGESYSATLTGSDLTVGRVYMSETDITSSAYNSTTGIISISNVTGNITINEGEPVITPVSGVSLNKTTASISPSDIETLTATILPANATNKNVTWSTNNSHVTINPNGLTCTVTGASNGESIVTVTTEDGEFTASCAISVHQIALDHIAITTPPSKIFYHPGDVFSTNGMIVTAYYDDETNEVLDANEYTYSPSGALSTGDTTITVSYTYNGVTKIATQNITIATLESIEITTQPTITSYLAGQTFDPNGMIVTANWSDNTTSNAEGYTYSPDGALTAEDTEITITYTAGGVTRTTIQAITVVEGTMVWATDWCEGDVSKLTTNSKPQFGGFSDTRNVEIFAQGPKQVVAVRFKATQAGTIEVGSVGTANGAQRSQITTLTVTSDQVGQVAEFPLNITVQPGEIPYIQYASDTGLFAYTGDGAAPGKSFYNKLGQGIAGTSGNSGLGVDFAYLEVPEPAKTPTAITITTPPTKINYFVGESFSNNGMIVTASYGDSTTANVNDYTWSPSGALSIEDDTITISYTENGTTVTTTQSITISEPKTLDSIAVTTLPKTSYNVGQVFNPNGMVVTATYEDESTQPINDYILTRTTLKEDKHETGSTTVGTANSRTDLGTLWLTTQSMGELPGSTLKDIFLTPVKEGGIITIRGYDTPIDGTGDLASLKAAAADANANGYDICTINAMTDGMGNQFMLDGSDFRVTIINQAAIDNCPAILGFSKSTDTNTFKYHSTGMEDKGYAYFIFETASTEMRNQSLDFFIDYKKENSITDPLTLEDEQINISYTFDDVTAKTVLPITVTKAPQTTWYTNVNQFSGWENPTANSITTAGDFGYSGSDVKALYEDKTINMVRLVPAKAGTITVRIYNDASNIVGRTDSATLRDNSKTATITITQDMVNKGGYQEIPLSNDLYVGEGQFWTIQTEGDTGLFKFVNSATIPGWPNGYRFYNQLGTTKAVILTQGQNALCVDMGYRG